jgi:hypothetical protein
MIADLCGNGWLQSGYLRAYAQGDITVSQLWNPFNMTVPLTKFGSTVSAGQIHHYWQWAAGTKYYSQDGSDQIISALISNVTQGWCGYSQQFFGEDKYVSSDMPGGSSYPATTASMEVETPTQSWQNLPCPFLTGANDSTQYDSRWGGPSPTSCYSFNIWTANYGA